MSDHNLDKTISWQTALSQAIQDPQELLSLLELHDPDLVMAAQAASQLFPLKVPRGFVARMQKGNIHDPLLKQILPLGAELIETPGFKQDPLEENSVNPIPG